MTVPKISGGQGVLTELKNKFFPTTEQKIAKARARAEKQLVDTEAMLRRHPLVPIVEKAILAERQAHKRNKYQKLDFLENVLSRLSNEAFLQEIPKTEKKEPRNILKAFTQVRTLPSKDLTQKNLLPATPRILLENAEDLPEFTRLWKRFTSADTANEHDVHEKLNDVYGFWRRHRRPQTEENILRNLKYAAHKGMPPIRHK